MKLNFTALSYFRKVAELQHMTRAATELHIAQPALSRTVRSLEKELGVSLFTPKGRNIILTKEGEVLLRYTRNFFRDLNNLESELNRLQNTRQMTVELVILPASKLIPIFLMKFKEEHPEAIIEILQQNSESADSNHKTDLVLFSSAQPVDNDHTVTLFRENLVMAIPDTDPHSRLPYVLLKDFADFNFIAPPKGMQLRDSTESLCRASGFSPKVVMESDNPDTAREFIRAGLGVALAPQMTWYSIKGDHIAIVPVLEPDCHRYLNLSWRSDKKLSLIAVLLREYIIDHLWEFVKQSADE